MTKIVNLLGVFCLLSLVSSGNVTESPITRYPTRSPVTPDPTRSPVTPDPTQSPTTPAPTRTPSQSPTGLYYDNPLVKWSHHLSGATRKVYTGTSPRLGNGVVISRDNSKLFVTDDGGRLHILNANRPKKNQKAFKPNLAKADWDLISKSSVALYYVDNILEYAIYSVIDIPTTASGVGEQSRIIAVNPLGGEVWSLEVQGFIVGTPVISTDLGNIYIIHNVDHKNKIRGYFTILNVLNGKVILTEENEQNYGPISLIHSNRKDILYWGESRGRGYGEEGIVHKGTVRANGEVHLEALTMTRWSTAAAPTVSGDGQSVWMSGSGGWIRGFTGDMKLNEQMMWKADLDTSQRNKTQPLYSRAILSSDESFLYVASASTSFYCLESHSGKVVWKNSEEASSVSLTEAKLSPDESKVYSIRHNDGSVVQQDAQTGDILWEVNCAFVTDSPYCQDSVEAEFTLNSDGSTLYYVDIFGRLTALLMGLTAPPTPSPTSHPTTTTDPSVSPTQSPTPRPTPKPTHNPTKPPSPRPTKSPSDRPTRSHTQFPTKSPTKSPTTHPTSLPTPSPATPLPTPLPTSEPTPNPTVHPTIEPTPLPTSTSSNRPTASPSISTTMPSDIIIQQRSGGNDGTDANGYDTTGSDSTNQASVQLKVPGSSIIIAFAVFVMGLFALLISLVLVRWYRRRKI